MFHKLDWEKLREYGIGMGFGGKGVF